jgi:chemotaxis protein CheX
VKMDLIQPFINSADAVLAELLRGRTEITDVTMDEQAHRRKGVAAVVVFRGDVEGRVIFDLDPQTARNVASRLATEPMDASPEIMHEIVLELANQVVGNAVTTLNDAGFRFKVRPPEPYAADRGLESTEDTEAIVLSFDTVAGSVLLNIAVRFNRRRERDKTS